jgi:hypothetical protein
MAVLRLVRWLILAVAVATVAAELALGRSYGQIGLTVLAVALLYWLLGVIERKG